MKVWGQLHAPVAFLLEKEPLEPTVYEAGSRELPVSTADIRAPAIIMTAIRTTLVSRMDIDNNS